MEKYQSAFIHRHTETEILHQSGRKIAAMHFGGVTIECLLKSMIVAKAAIQEWKTDSNNPGHTITNPGHSYIEALKRHNRLKSRVQNFPDVIKWLNEVENPNLHFIPHSALHFVAYIEYKKTEKDLSINTELFSRRYRHC